MLGALSGIRTCDKAVAKPRSFVTLVSQSVFAGVCEVTLRAQMEFGRRETVEVRVWRERSVTVRVVSAMLSVASVAICGFGPAPRIVAQVRCQRQR